MILIDFNSIVIFNIIKNNIISEDVIRNICINTIRSVTRKFKFNFSMKYGIFIVDDDKNYWKKQYFSYYKMNRENLYNIDFKLLYNYLTNVKKEIYENFPFKVLKVNNCEADDIIAVITNHVVNYDHEDVLIVSPDKDYVQLHCPFVYQFSPLSKKMISFRVSPTYDLYEKIFLGDKIDGIPNYISQDEALVEGTEKKVDMKRINFLLESVINIEKKLNDEEKYGFYRNKKIIDFSEIPNNIKENILNTFFDSLKKESPSLLNTSKYLREHNLGYLLNKIGDFQ